MEVGFDSWVNSRVTLPKLVPKKLWCNRNSCPPKSLFHHRLAAAVTEQTPYLNPIPFHVLNGGALVLGTEHTEWYSQIFLFWDRILWNHQVAQTCDPPTLVALGCWDYRHAPLRPASRSYPLHYISCNYVLGNSCFEKLKWNMLKIIKRFIQIYLKGIYLHHFLFYTFYNTF